MLQNIYEMVASSLDAVPSLVPYGPLQPKNSVDLEI